MKRKLRIKLIQELSKAKGITLVDRDLSKKDSCRLRAARNKLNDKIIFYKMINRIIEKSDKND